MPQASSLISSTTTHATFARPTFAIVGEPFIELSTDTPLRLAHIPNPRLITSVTQADVSARLVLVARNTLEATLPSQLSRFPLSELDYALFQALAAGIAAGDLAKFLKSLSAELLSLCRNIERYPDKDIAASLGAARLRTKDRAKREDDLGPENITQAIRAAAASAARESYSGSDASGFENLLSGLFATVGRGAYTYLTVGAATIGTTSDANDNDATVIVATLESLQLMPLACRTDLDKACAYLAASAFLANVEKLAELRLEPSFQPAFAEQVANRLREYSVALRTLAHLPTVVRLATARHNVSALLELFTQFAGIPVDFSAKLQDADERVASAKAQTLLTYRDDVDAIINALAAEREAQIFLIADNMSDSLMLPRDTRVPSAPLTEVSYKHYARLASGAPVVEEQISGSAPVALLSFATAELTAYTETMLKLQADGSYYHSAPTLLDLPRLRVARGPSILMPRLRCISDEGDYAVGIPQISWETDSTGARVARSILAKHCFSPVVLSSIEGASASAGSHPHALALAGVRVPADGAVDPWLRSLPVPASYLEGEQPVPARLTMADFLRHYSVERAKMGFDPLIDLTVQLTSSSDTARSYLLAHLASSFLTLAPKAHALGTSGDGGVTGVDRVAVQFADEKEPSFVCLLPSPAKFPPYVYGVRADLFVKAQLASFDDKVLGPGGEWQSSPDVVVHLPFARDTCIQSRNTTSVVMVQIAVVPDLREHNVKPFFTYFKINNSTLAPCARVVIGAPSETAKKHVLPLSGLTDYTANLMGLPEQSLPSVFSATSGLKWVPYEPSEAEVSYHAFRWTLRPVLTWDRTRRVIDADGRFLAWRADWIGYVQPSALLMNPQPWKMEPVVTVASDIPPAPAPASVSLPPPSAVPPVLTPPVLESEAPAPGAVGGLANQGVNRSPESTESSQEAL